MKYLVIACLLISLNAFPQNQPLTNVVNGQNISIRDYKGAKGVVVIFTSNVCAYDGYYTERLKSLISAYSSNVQFVLVNSYTEPEEGNDKMKTRYDSWGLNIPYLADKNQEWMKALGAKKSPEAFLLNADFKVIYSGAIDDNPQLASGVKENYLKKAIDDLIAGKTIGVTTVRAVGCSIRTK